LPSQSALSPLFSARSGSVPGYDDGEGLKLKLPLAQSAFSPLLSAAWLKISSFIAVWSDMVRDVVVSKIPTPARQVLRGRYTVAQFSPDAMQRG
jgi:hypothetical protein